MIFPRLSARALLSRSSISSICSNKGGVSQLKSETKYIQSFKTHLLACNNLLSSRFISTSASPSSPVQSSTRSENKIASETTSPAKEQTSADSVLVTFKKPDGSDISVRGAHGKSLYNLVVDNDLDIDGFGACEGTLCCTTCHLIFSKDDYDRVGHPKDEELDMLDLAFGLTDTSRLGCQVILKKEMGSKLQVQVPEGINDSRE